MYSKSLWQYGTALYPHLLPAYPPQNALTITMSEPSTIAVFSQSVRGTIVLLTATATPTEGRLSCSASCLMLTADVSVGLLLTFTFIENNSFLGTSSHMMTAVP